MPRCQPASQRRFTRGLVPPSCACLSESQSYGSGGLATLFSANSSYLVVAPYGSSSGYCHSWCRCWWRAPFNILPLHNKNLILRPRAGSPNKSERLKKEGSPNERNLVYQSTKQQHQSKTTRDASARATRDRGAAQHFSFTLREGYAHPGGVCLPAYRFPPNTHHTLSTKLAIETPAGL